MIIFRNWADALDVQGEIKRLYPDSRILRETEGYSLRLESGRFFCKADYKLLWKTNETSSLSKVQDRV